MSSLLVFSLFTQPFIAIHTLLSWFGGKGWDVPGVLGVIPPNTITSRDCGLLPVSNIQQKLFALLAFGVGMFRLHRRGLLLLQRTRTVCGRFGVGQGTLYSSSINTPLKCRN